MSQLQIEWIAILAVAAAALLAGAIVGVLAERGTPGAPYELAFAHREGHPLLWGVVDASIVAVLSPILGLLVLVFLATFAPPFLAMIPFFVVWAIGTHEERKHAAARRWEVRPLAHA